MHQVVAPRRAREADQVVDIERPGERLQRRLVRATAHQRALQIRHRLPQPGQRADQDVEPLHGDDAADPQQHRAVPLQSEALTRQRPGPSGEDGRVHRPVHPGDAATRHAQAHDFSCEMLADCHDRVHRVQHLRHASPSPLVALQLQHV